MAIQLAPRPRGATSRQAHEAERWQHRYGRVFAAVTPSGELRLDIYGDLSWPWATLLLCPDGWPLGVQHHTNDPRENGLKRAHRQALAELRARPSEWHSGPALALALEFTPSWTTTVLGVLVNAGLVEREGQSTRDVRYRATPPRL
jgi:hypothetical protein